MAQEVKKDQDNHYKQLEKKYQYLKDSLQNGYNFVPAVSSVMLQNGQFESIFFSSISSANKLRDDKGRLNEFDFRSTYLYNTLQVTYGFSKNGRLNIGLDLNTKVTRIDAIRNSSMFKVFNSDVYGKSRYASGITSFGPRVRINPSEKNNYFTLQSSILFPTVKEEKEVILGQNQISFLAQFLYNRPLSNHFFLFSQLGGQYGFKNGNVPSTLIPSVSGYLNYYIPKRIVIFALINYFPIFSNNDNWSFIASSLQVGGGLQYQFSKKILINAFYTNNVAGNNFLDFDSYTVSLRFSSN